MNANHGIPDAVLIPVWTVNTVALFVATNGVSESTEKASALVAVEFSTGGGLVWLTWARKVRLNG